MRQSEKKGHHHGQHHSFILRGPSHLVVGLVEFTDLELLEQLLAAGGGGSNSALLLAFVVLSSVFLYTPVAALLDLTTTRGSKLETR